MDEIEELRARINVLNERINALEAKQGKIDPAEAEAFAESVKGYIDRTIKARQHRHKLTTVIKRDERGRVMEIDSRDI